MVTLHHGDCLDVLKTLPDNSIDSIVTDPPYGLAFMGKRWDYDVPSIEVWQECLRVLKPGGHLLAFAGTRTQHRMAVRIEDAGFEIRDMIAWVYSTGFPKSLDVSKAIDKSEGFWRGRAGSVKSGNDAMSGGNYERTPKGDPITAAAAEWQGWGTALKPALEPITVARKPLIGTVAENVLQWGVGGLNVDGCRVGTNGEAWSRENNVGSRIANGIPATKSALNNGVGAFVNSNPLGRFPANIIHDGSEEVVGLFPQSEGMKRGTLRRGATTGLAMGAHGIYGEMQPMEVQAGYGDSGSAARFFYCAKASKADREEGLEGAPDRVLAMSNQAKAELARGNMHEGESGMNTAKVRKNHHPTVKPTDLMRYLCRLITPPNGVVLDPFMGSGSTGKAAALEGFRFIGIEREAEYVRIATARIEHAQQQREMELV